MIKRSARAAKFLTEIKPHVLEELILKFQEDIFPNSARESLLWSFQKILERAGIKADPLTTYQSMCLVMDVLDKGNKGFLTGDLSLKFIHSFGKTAQDLVDSTPEALKTDYVRTNQTMADEWNSYIDQFYEQIFGYCSSGLFKLPEFGIKHSQHENQYNLFQRQLILEAESKNMAVEKFQNVFEDLQSLGTAYNLSFAKNYIKEWLPSLCETIKEEQEKCLLGNLQGDRKYYGPNLVKMSAEKLALISLSELMKPILGLVQSKSNFQRNKAETFLLTKLVVEGISKALTTQLVYDLEESLVKERKSELSEDKANKEQENSSVSEEDKNLVMDDLNLFMNPDPEIPEATKDI